MSSDFSENPGPEEMPFFGLAPFLRMSIAGTDLLPYGQDLLAQVGERPADANLLMNLSLAMQCLGQREFGLAVQEQALALRRIYELPALTQPSRLRVLLLTVAGDISANTPLECLLETGDIDLIYYYVSPGEPLALPMPDHDVLMVALGDSAENRAVLSSLEQSLANWSKPVINVPQHIPRTDRHALSRLLGDAPGVVMPATLPAERAALQAIADGAANLPESFAGCDFPIILRPIDSQAGRDLDRIGDCDELAAYLARVAEAQFFIARFVDYRSADGLYRKYRVALIDGEAFACHMGVSAHWMVHYVNAGMYEEAWKREEEARFMDGFADFAQRHSAAFRAVHERVALDYLCIDCAETAGGRFLIFEADHCMVVHAMDPEDLFPYKQVHMAKVKAAFENYLLKLTEGRA